MGEYHILDFLCDENAKDIIKCPACLDLMVDPVVKDCHHCICSSCSEKLHMNSRNEKECPVCRCVGTGYHPIFIVRDMIALVKARCPHEGCDEIIGTQTWYSHVARCEKQPVVACENEGCSEKIPAQDRAEHDKTCAYKIVECPSRHCSARATRLHIRAHMRECAHIMKSCPACGIAILPKDLITHMAGKQCKRSTLGRIASVLTRDDKMFKSFQDMFSAWVESHLPSRYVDHNTETTFEFAGMYVNGGPVYKNAEKNVYQWPVNDYDESRVSRGHDDVTEPWIMMNGSRAGYQSYLRENPWVSETKHPGMRVVYYLHRAAESDPDRHTFMQEMARTFET